MRYLVLVFIMFISSFVLNAQPPRGGLNRPNTPPMGMGGNERPKGLFGEVRNSDMLELHIAVMIKHLKLNSKQSKLFAEVYTKYYTDISNLPMLIVDIDDNTSDQELEVQIYNSFDNTDYTTAIKRKYYKEFKEVLSIRQIFMMYGIEREFLERISLENKRRIEGNN